MKEKIINILREHPGLRKREIAYYLNCHHFTIITTLYEMEDEGLLRVESVHNTASMEFYDKYFAIGQEQFLELFLFLIQGFSEMK